MWLIWAVVCLPAAPRVQYFRRRGKWEPNNARRYY